MNNVFFSRKKRRRRINEMSKIASRSFPKNLARLFGLLVLIIFCHTLAMHFLEGLSYAEALWLSFTTITTVGYGDVSAVTLEGRLATVLLIYVLGIWLMAQLVGEFLDFRADKREQKVRGLWRWKNMADHILIINTPSVGGDRYLIRLIEQIRLTPGLSDKAIQIVSREYGRGLPERLKMLDVVHRHLDSNQTVDLDAVNIAEASYVIILCQDESDVRSDSVTLDVLDKVCQSGDNPYIVAECTLDENRSRFERLGANTVIRPVRGYPELIVRAMSAPGTEKVLEDLFTHHGASTKRIDMSVSGKKWKDIACKIIVNGLGTPLGYIAESGEVVTNPDCDEIVEAVALLVMAGEEILHSKTIEKVIA